MAALAAPRAGDGVVTTAESGTSVVRAALGSPAPGLRRLTAVQREAPKYPRVSPKTKRVFGWVLTGIWLGGTPYLLEELHTGLWGPIALLAAVGAVELAFSRWNNGHWPGSDSAST